MRKNPLKKKIKDGQVIIGAFVRIAAPALVEICAYSGFDFVVLDAEHGPLSERDVENLVRAADAANIPALVRVPVNSHSTILRFMDTGSMGVHVPMINTVEQASSAVQAVKYPPIGDRGLAGVRASGYGQLTPLHEYVVRANEETMVVIHLEDINGVNNIDAILEVDGVDVIFIGPVDLSSSIGVPGQTGAPQVQEAISTIVNKARANAKTLGTTFSDSTSAKTRIEEGYRYLLIGTDSILASASRELLKSIR